jgi:signal transduction histidine kinase
MKRIIRAGFFQKIVLPAMLAIILFVISLYVFVIPSFERSAIEQKRQMLHELTNTAWSILDKYHNDAVAGLVTHDEAQQLAITEIEALRYGRDEKDYFWITDLEPAMIMHPYVHELTGQSLQDYVDPDGKRLFIEAAELARSEGEGFISYKWQLRDDSSRVVPKLSFIKRFAPWEWIIGTGIYLDDVQAEISSLTNKLLLILLGITIIIALIIFFITYQSLEIETRRRKAEDQLRESREKYRSLLESSTEGIILLLNSSISYTNSYIQNWLQYTGSELHSMSIEAIFPSRTAARPE